MQKAQSRCKPSTHFLSLPRQFATSTLTTTRKPRTTKVPETTPTTEATFIDSPSPVKATKPRTKKVPIVDSMVKVPKDTTPKPRRSTRAETTTPDSPKVLSQDQITNAIKDAATPSSASSPGLTDPTLLRRTSTKTVIDMSVVGTHENTNMPEHLVKLTRKITKSDDHETNDRVFETQKPIDPKVLANKDSVLMTTWNVAGFRGALKNGFWDKLSSWERQPEILCLQEMKIQSSALAALKDDEFASQLKKYNYQGVYNLGEKAGYSGVAIFYKSDRLNAIASKEDSSFAYPFKTKAPQGGLTKFFKPSTPANESNSVDTTVGSVPDQTVFDKISAITGDKVTNAMRQEVWTNITQEGRMLTVDFGSFFVVTTYVPNSGQELDRLHYRYAVYEPVILEYLMLLQNQKPVLYNGDLNAARDVSDVHTPSSCSKSAGFQPEEIERINRLVYKTGLVDTFRTLQGDNVHGYTYWGHRFQGRAKNRGWRIDYWMVSDSLQQHCVGTMVTDEFKPPSAGEGRISDHAPLWIAFDGAILNQKL